MDRRLREIEARIANMHIGPVSGTNATAVIGGLQDASSASVAMEWVQQALQKAGIDGYSEIYNKCGDRLFNGMVFVKFESVHKRDRASCPLFLENTAVWTLPQDTCAAGPNAASASILTGVECRTLLGWPNCPLPPAPKVYTSPIVVTQAVYLKPHATFCTGSRARCSTARGWCPSKRSP